jgi:transposase-like protein
MPPNTLKVWLAKAGWRPPARGANDPVLPAGPPAAPESDDPAVLKIRLKELEAENRRLRMEKEILKKATAFFAQEHP